jgi:hypothetical protein
MKISAIYFIGLLFWGMSTVKGQDKATFVNNKTIKFHVVRKSMELIDTNMIVPSKYFIRVELNNKQRSVIKNYTSADWMKLLNNVQSDWAANLILYEMHERDAFLFWSVVKNKERWRLSAKEEDIKYWNEHLK